MMNIVMSQPSQMSVLAAGLAQGRGDLDLVLGRGRDLLERGDLAGAHEAFRVAQRIDGNDPRVLSLLGYTLTLVAHDEQKGVAFCEEAIRRGGEDADALWRLASVYKITFQRQRAVRAVLRGLQLDPKHQGHQGLLGEVSLRRPPVLSFLGRQHPLNRLLGQIRHRVLGPAGHA